MCFRYSYKYHTWAHSHSLTPSHTLAHWVHRAPLHVGVIINVHVNNWTKYIVLTLLLRTWGRLHKMAHHHARNRSTFVRYDGDDDPYEGRTLTYLNNTSRYDTMCTWIYRLTAMHTVMLPPEMIANERKNCTNGHRYRPPRQSYVINQMISDSAYTNSTRISAKLICL